MSALIGVVVASAALGASASGAGEDVRSRPFYVYNFGRLTERSAAEQSRLLRTIGYDGMAVSCASAGDAALLDDYLRAADDSAGKFKVFATFVRYNFEAAAADRERWREILGKIAGRGIDLWLIIGKPTPSASDAVVDRIVGEVADAAARRGVTVVLYPHSLCYIASAEQALPFLQRLARPNLGVAVHLYHEMRAGNGDRIEAVIKNVGSHLRAATLAGTNSVVDRSSARTMDEDTIKPLDRGDYDVSRFIRALDAGDFRGPVGFMNFKIAEEPDDYLPRSFAAWRRLEQAARARR